jgi:hypothetical protein
MFEILFYIVIKDIGEYWGIIIMDLQYGKYSILLDKLIIISN